MKLLLLALAVSAVSAYQLKPSCDKPLYCQSKLLHHVQMARIFPDSKTFVDLHMKYDEKTIMDAFDSLLKETKERPSKKQLEKFVNNYFESGNELESWKPTDFNPEPSFLAEIKDIKLRQFAKDINNIWPVLGRKVKPAVFEKPEYYSLIPVHNGFIIPGGKFKEFYYWDTYWIIEGLLVSGMKDTVKGIIGNLLELQRTLGHIPNGDRWYYQQRSQPPLLSAMMMKYLEATHDVEFLRANIDALESELQYWLDTQSIIFKKDGKEHTLLRYYTPSEGPRPESYYEDYTRAQIFETEERQKQFYTDIKSAAESGWDFSSRWFINKDGSNIGNLTSVHASDIIPVDLNAIFGNSMQNIAYCYSLLRNSRRGAHWAHIAKQWRSSIKEVLWNDEDGIWYDWDLSNDVHRKYFYPSNIVPLWMDVADKSFVKEKAQHILAYMKKTHSLEFPGGVPTSLIRSGERWDFPNAWPPLVSMVVKSLEALQTEESLKLAFEVAQNWVRSNYLGYLTSHQLFEKYDVESPGKSGGEGEYAVQAGFGWTNGAILQMLAKYGQTLKAQDSYYNFNEYKPNPVFWHIPTSAHLPSHYKDSNSAPVLTDPSSLHQFVYTSSSVNSGKPSAISTVSSEHSYVSSISGKPESVVQISTAAVQPVPLSTVEAVPAIPEKKEELTQKVEISSTSIQSDYAVSKPEQIATDPVKPEHIPSIPVKPQHFPSFPVKPEHVSSGSVKPEHISTVVYKPEYIPTAEAKPEYVVTVAAKPELTQSDEVKPFVPVKPEEHFVSTTSVQSDYISTAPVKPEYVPSFPVKPEHVSSGSVKPEHISTVVYKPEYIPIAEAKPEYVVTAAAKPELTQSDEVKPFVPVKPEEHFVSTTSVQSDYISTAPAKPEYVPSFPVKPEHVSSGSVKPEHISTVVYKPEYIPIAEAKPEYVVTVAAKPELTQSDEVKPSVPVKPEEHFVSTTSAQSDYISTAPAKPEYVPSFPVKPEHVSSGSVKPEHISTVVYKPEYIPTAEAKPEYVVTVAAKPELTQSDEVKPFVPVKPEEHFVSTTSVQSDYISTAPAKPEYVPSFPVKPEHVSSGSVKPEHISTVVYKPEYIQTAAAKPEYVVTVAVKPEITQSDEVKPFVPVKPEEHFVSTTSVQSDYISTAPAKPEYVPSFPVKPEHVSSGSVKPEHISTVVYKPEYIPTAEAKPEYVVTVAAKPELTHTDEAKPSVPVKPEEHFISTTSVQSDYISNAAVKPEYTPSFPLKPKPTLIAAVMPELTSSVSIKPEQSLPIPVKPESSLPVPVKPEPSLPVSVKPEPSSAASVKPVPAKPGHISINSFKPGYISSVTLKPEYIPTPEAKPEYIVPVPAKPEQAFTAETKPEVNPVFPVKPEQQYVSSVSVQSDYIPSTPAKPEYTESTPAKFELVASTHIKPEHIPTGSVKPEHVLPVPVKPEYIPTTEVKPELSPSTPVKPEESVTAPVKPKPAYVSSTLQSDFHVSGEISHDALVSTEHVSSFPHSNDKLQVTSVSASGQSEYHSEENKNTISTASADYIPATGSIFPPSIGTVMASKPALTTTQEIVPPKPSVTGFVSETSQSGYTGSAFTETGKETLKPTEHVIAASFPSQTSHSESFISAEYSGSTHSAGSQSAFYETASAVAPALNVASSFATEQATVEKVSPQNGFAVEYKPVKAEHGTPVVSQSVGSGPLTGFAAAAINTANSFVGQAQTEQSASPQAGFSIGSKPIKTEQVASTVSQTGSAGILSGFTGAVNTASNFIGQAHKEQSAVPQAGFSVGSKPIQTEQVSTLTSSGNAGGLTGFTGVVNAASNFAGQAQVGQNAKPSLSAGYKPTKPSGNIFSNFLG